MEPDRLGRLGEAVATQEGHGVGCSTIQDIYSIYWPERQPDAQHRWMGSRGQTATHVLPMD
eukprot:13842717-Heterocapsa_arctica.AAC.1